jgi:hypothetical protein
LQAAASVELGGRLPTTDATAIARASEEFLRKHQPSTHAPEMVRTEILPTTLRLEPR